MIIHDALREAIRQYYPRATMRGDSKLFPHTEIVHFRSGNVTLVAKLIEEKVLRTLSVKEHMLAMNFLSDIMPRYYARIKKNGCAGAFIVPIGSP